MSDITRVGVIGAGLMGSGIAEVCARAGLDVVVREIDDAAASAGLARIEGSLIRGVKSGKLTSPERDAALATNTSSIPVIQVARATSRPEQVLGLHFFNPAPVRRLVEVIPSVLTGDETTARARAFAADVLGKAPIAAPDRSGFVVNALLVPYLLAAIRMVEAGHATAADIDTGMVLGCAHPMGPLKLSDLIGLDTLQSIADSLYAEYAEPLYAAPPLLRRMTAAGLLGRKSGQGFYDYTGRPGQPNQRAGR